MKWFNFVHVDERAEEKLTALREIPRGIPRGIASRESHFAEFQEYTENGIPINWEEDVDKRNPIPVVNGLDTSPFQYSFIHGDELYSAITANEIQLEGHDLRTSKAIRQLMRKTSQQDVVLHKQGEVLQEFRDDLRILKGKRGLFDSVPALHSRRFMKKSDKPASPSHSRRLMNRLLRAEESNNGLN